MGRQKGGDILKLEEKTMEKNEKTGYGIRWRLVDGVRGHKRLRTPAVGRLLQCDRPPGARWQGRKCEKVHSVGFQEAEILQQSQLSSYSNGHKVVFQ